MKLLIPFFLAMCFLDAQGTTVNGDRTVTGIVQAGGYKSSDGTAGTTGAGFKNGLCTTAAGGCGGGGANITSGPFASLTGTCTHTSTQSDLYYFTAGFYRDAICTATNTWTYNAFGLNGVTPPPGTGSFSSGGQSGTFSAINGSLYLATPASTTGPQYRYIAAPSTPWSITIAVSPNLMNNTNVSAVFQTFSLSFSDGTKLVNCALGDNLGNQAYIYGMGASTQATTSTNTQVVCGDLLRHSIDDHAATPYKSSRRWG